ncbi:YqgQ family protein [Virgibacillus sp. C22-A2]|uniref:YqgQ family protein n=1 Tax=Virgibacillus tibetensis TaxID=3042313 RepID=A0ABU6KCS0_9BACI|nr:YqgQ family protein [Virgibacillus sp. C22-A2]
MKTMYDVQQLLKKYGTFIYTGNRFGDLELMEMEVNELYQLQFILPEDYTVAKLIIRRERSQLHDKKG